MKPTKYFIALVALLATALTVEAQIDTIVRAFVDQAARNSQQRPQQQHHRPEHARAGRRGPAQEPVALRRVERLADGARLREAEARLSQMDRR